MTLATPVTLDDLPTIDLLVFGSVAVTPGGDRNCIVARLLDRSRAAI